jgi:hypothetical protein
VLGTHAELGDTPSLLNRGKNPVEKKRGDSKVEKSYAWPDKELNNLVN